MTTAEGDYQFAVPAAYSYSSVTITTSAYSHGGTTRMFGALRTVIGLSPHVMMSPTAPAVSNLGTFTGGIVNASHQVIVGVGVDNSLRSPSDLDIGWVAITCTTPSSSHPVGTQRGGDRVSLLTHRCTLDKASVRNVNRTRCWRRAEKNRRSGPERRGPRRARR